MCHGVRSHKLVHYMQLISQSTFPFQRQQSSLAGCEWQRRDCGRDVAWDIDDGAVNGSLMSTRQAISFMKRTCWAISTDSSSVTHSADSCLWRQFAANQMRMTSYTYISLIVGIAVCKCRLYFDILKTVQTASINVYDNWHMQKFDLLVRVYMKNSDCRVKAPLHCGSPLSTTILYLLSS